ncbi:hypothetical protein IW261DRAFT_1631990 [Armillaria novae-zelandiae]|uniref:Uncharacterized protein n=1 Tax=Armillaria novae-zelandiae TaxID=153914 RepID=A0AA39UGE6_9AGAR|nr:hypothetical protein IW261DRAFT_1631990 [Armillaria novae-zelandiae]
MQTANEKGDPFAYRRWYIFNGLPDLVTRLEKNIRFPKYDRSILYVAGDASGVGYTGSLLAH